MLFVTDIAVVCSHIRTADRVVIYIPAAISDQSIAAAVTPVKSGTHVSLNEIILPLRT